jgi:ribonuclease BN (tRNA processing enzyme)
MQNKYLKFIGTSSGETQKSRFHSSFVFNSGSKFCLIDAGDGISKALLTAEIPFKDIDTVIISHMHPDHYTGLASLIVQMKLLKRETPFTVYTHESIIDTIKNFIISSKLLPQRMEFPLNYESFEYDEFFNPFPGLEVIARHNSHLSGLKNEQGNINISCSSFLFQFAGKQIFYTGDIASEEDLYLFNDYNIDLMISEITHIDTDLIVKAFQSLKAEKLYLTHISRNDGEKLKALIGGKTNSNIFAADDGMKINF